MRNSLQTRPALLLLLCAFFGACLGGKPIQYYRIDVPVTPASSAKAYDVTLLIARVDSPRIMRDGPILYRVGDHEIGAYTYHRWVETPDRMVQDSLIRLLRSSGKYQAVEEQNSRSTGDYVVRGKIYEFAEVDNPEVQTRVSMEIELREAKTGRTMWSQLYTHEEPVNGKKIPDVVRSLDRNFRQGLAEFVTALDQYFASRSPGD
ncbi:MAG TPA: ABC-type transport auxiliary lipoprotein family protein [Terriglobia bacterium]|nr:ABC-type transport auxiliary lipoprotein family protein [Terriglobia bacterium]